MLYWSDLYLLRILVSSTISIPYDELMKGRQYNGQTQKDKKNIKYSTKPLHRKLEIEQHEPHKKPGIYNHA
jgi:inner membrane protein involved in colicin E2 resistance